MTHGVDTFNLLNRVSFARYGGTLCSPFSWTPAAAVPACGSLSAAIAF